MSSLLAKIWDEIKHLTDAFFKDRELQTKQKRVISYLKQLSSSQKTALRGTFRSAQIPDEPVYWDMQGLPCPVLMYLGFFLEEEALMPLKHCPPGKTGYRFAPWFHKYLSEHQEVLE